MRRQNVQLVFTLAFSFHISEKVRYSLLKNSDKMTNLQLSKELTWSSCFSRIFTVRVQLKMLASMKNCLNMVRYRFSTEIVIINGQIFINV